MNYWLVLAALGALIIFAVRMSLPAVVLYGDLLGGFMLLVGLIGCLFHWLLH